MEINIQPTACWNYEGHAGSVESFIERPTWQLLARLYKLWKLDFRKCLGRQGLG
jgi:hypothetical protein